MNNSLSNPFTDYVTLTINSSSKCKFKFHFKHVYINWLFCDTLKVHLFGAQTFPHKQIYSNLNWIFTTVYKVNFFHTIFIVWCSVFIKQLLKLTERAPTLHFPGLNMTWNIAIELQLILLLTSQHGCIVVDRRILSVCRTDVLCFSACHSISTSISQSVCSASLWSLSSSVWLMLTPCTVSSDEH